MNPTKSLERTVNLNFLMLGSGETVARIIVFATLVYIARVLGVQAYGLVGLAATVILYFSGVADFGIENLGPRVIAEDPRRIASVVPAVIAGRLLISLVLVAILMTVGYFWVIRLEGLVLGIYSLSLLAIGGSTRWAHLGLEKAGMVGLTRILGEGLRALLILLFVHGPDDVIFVPAAHVAGDVAVTIILAMWLRQYGFTFRSRLNWHYVWPIFRQSWTLVVTTLIGLVIYNSDLFFLRIYRGMDEVGFYLAAFTLITLMGNLGTSYSASLLPALTRSGQEGDQQRELYHTAMAQVFTLSFPIAVGGFIVAPKAIEFWFGQTYTQSGFVLQILIWSVPFLLLRGVLQSLLIASGRHDYVMFASICAVILNLLMNVVIIPKYGMYGAAFTTVITEIIRMSIVQIFVRIQRSPIVDYRRFWRGLLAALGMFATLAYIWSSSLWSLLAAGMLTYVVALAIIGGVRFRRDGLPTLNV